MANLLQQYIEQGLEQGPERGRVGGQRDTIRTVLRSRFGSVPEAVERRIAAANTDELESLAARAGTVTTLGDL